jgi:hypothetical protein
MDSYRISHAAAQRLPRSKQRFFAAIVAPLRRCVRNLF